MSAEDRERLSGLTVSGDVVDGFSHFGSVFVLNSFLMRGSENMSSLTVFAFHFVKLLRSY